MGIVVYAAGKRSHANLIDSFSRIVAALASFGLGFRFAAGFGHTPGSHTFNTDLQQISGNRRYLNPQGLAKFKMHILYH